MSITFIVEERGNEHFFVAKRTSGGVFSTKRITPGDVMYKYTHGDIIAESVMHYNAYGIVIKNYEVGFLGGWVESFFCGGGTYDNISAEDCKVGEIVIIVTKVHDTC